MFNPQQSLMLRNFFVFKKQLVNYRGRNWPKTFWGFRETHTRTLKCECINKQGGQDPRGIGRQGDSETETWEKSSRGKRGAGKQGKYKKITQHFLLPL